MLGGVKHRFTKKRSTRVRHTKGRSTRGRHTRVRRNSKKFSVFGNHSYTSKGGAVAEGAKAPPNSVKIESKFKLPYIDPETGTIVTSENLKHFNTATGEIKNLKAYRKFIEEQADINNEKVKVNRNEGERLIKEEEEQAKEFLESRGYIVTKIVETPRRLSKRNPRRKINTRSLNKKDEEALEQLRKLKDETNMSMENYIKLVHQYFRDKNLFF